VGVVAVSDIVKGSGKHLFGRVRPAKIDPSALQIEPTRDTHFRPLPGATGVLPFHLDLKDVIAKRDYQAIVKNQKLVFHLNGDMGGINYAVPQLLVAKGMEAEFFPDAKAGASPAFLYMTGDCVYFNGESAMYYSQFYQPYEYYPAPIFAVPGNHDGENLPDQDTLDGFVRNFCAPKPVVLPESGDSLRTTMVQPNVYWTLLTPLINIVGLYSNVPSGGDIRSPQTEWLVSELTTLPTDVPLVVALHHPIYSADDHHSGSIPMHQVLEDATKAAGRHPDMIVAGHVHDYQRLTKDHGDGTITPYLVTGAGGYSNLHHIRKVNGKTMKTPVQFTDKNNDTVTLDAFNDDHHGFLHIEVTPDVITGSYLTVPRPQDPYSKPNELVDYFEYDWKNRTYRPNTQ
jgi:hypothetical protein